MLRPARPTAPGPRALALAAALILPLAACDPEGAGDDDTAAGDAHTGREYPTDGGSFVVSYAPDPDPIPANEYFALDVEVRDAATEDPAADADLAVDATMPSHGHGMNTQPVVTANGDGTFRVEGMLFHMTGEWRIDMEVTSADVTETVYFDVDCCKR